MHAKANGGEWKTHNIAVDSGWHTWRCQWDAAGIRFWKDYVDGAQPYFDVPADSLPDWPFNGPGYTVYPVFNLAVAGSGGGDPGPGSYPVADAGRLDTCLVVTDALPPGLGRYRGEPAMQVHPVTAKCQKLLQVVATWLISRSTAQPPGMPCACWAICRALGRRRGEE